MSTDSFPRSLETRLLQLGDVDFDALCEQHFPQVYVKFSRGLYLTEKVALLRRYCLRVPARIQALEAILLAME